jgi:hypothetical protein
MLAAASAHARYNALCPATAKALRIAAAAYRCRVHLP